MAKGEFENQVALILAIIGFFVYPFILLPIALIVGHKAKEISGGKYQTGFKVAKALLWVYIICIILFVIAYVIIF